MDELSLAKEHITKHRYQEAKAILEKIILHQKTNSDAFYLRGVVSLKLRNYGRANEYFQRALAFAEKPEYHKMKGMAHFEIFELDDAIESFLASLALKPNDAVSCFFISVCYMLMDDPRSAEYMKKAKEADGKKTKQLLSNFYTFYIKEDKSISDQQKKKIAQKIKSLS